MTVKELMEILSSEDPNALVIINNTQGFLVVDNLSKQEFWVNDHFKGRGYLDTPKQKTGFLKNWKAVLIGG